MINEKIISEWFIDEINNISKIPENVNTDKLKEQFIEFLEIDFYDWFKQNFDFFIFSKIESEWENK